ncbi:MAG: preprotein translocase subunit SecG [Pseudomonadales bacterium]
MSTYETVLMMLLVADAIALAALVLLQQGRGADVGAAFGSGSSNTMFGSSGSASFLTKLTVWLAIGFFLISFGLAYTAKERAETAGSLGIPQVVVPETPVEQLTPESKPVDSDIPDL